MIIFWLEVQYPLKQNASEIIPSLSAVYSFTDGEIKPNQSEVKI